VGRAAHHALPAHPRLPRARRGAHPRRRPHRRDWRPRPGRPPRGGGVRRMALDDSNGSALDVVAIKKDFPILEIEVHDGKRLVYLDSASSSQKPRVVLDAMERYYETTHANVHRGVYSIAEEATALYERGRARTVSVTAMSTVLVTLTPVRRLAGAAHAAGALLLVDGAQLLPHLATDVSDLDCDFLGFTGHKMLGPTGIGVLLAREALLEAMPAFL